MCTNALLQLKHLIINLDPDDEGNEDMVVTPKTPKTVPSTPSNHIINSSPQTSMTPNHIDSSSMSYESPEYQTQVSNI